MKRTIIILILLIPGFLFGQCKDISIGKAEIDKVLLDQYESIDSDTFLVINYGNSYLKYRGWGLISTFENGQIQAFKFTLRKNDQVKRTEIKRKKILSEIQNFFTETLWKIPDSLYLDPNIVVFHPDQLKIHYSDESTNWCKFFKNLSGFDERSRKDKRVIWINSIIKKV